MTRKNARIDSFVLDALGFENPDRSWTEKRAMIAKHRMHAAAARQQARYDADAREAVEYHDAEAERLEDELVAAGHQRPRGARYRKNPSERGALLVSEVAEGQAMQGTRMVWGDPFLPWSQLGAEPAGWFPDMQRENKWTLQWMSPKQFLRRADPHWNDEQSATVEEHREAKIASVLAAVDEGVVFAPLMLEPEHRLEHGGVSHEGRHRAEAAIRLGEKKVPVLVSTAKRRRNPVDDWVMIEDSAYALDEDAATVDDWVTIEECACSSCSIRTNPRAAKRRPEGAYADIGSIAPVIENALAQHDLTMRGIAEIKFTRGGKSRAGSCSYSPSLRQCKIMFNGLAWPAFTEEQRLNTILHEAAHAIQFLTTGRSDHGPVWTRIAKSIGCSGDRCTTVDESQRMADAYSEARGLPKRKVLTKESAMEASGDFAVGDYVSFEHKGERWYGKIVSKDATHARVIVQQPAMKVGVTGKIPYPLLQKEAPPRFAEKTAGVDKPAAGESLTAWLERTGRR